MSRWAVPPSLVESAEALFASTVPTDAVLTGPQIDEAVGRILALRGSDGCVADLAYAYGEYPEQSALRMRWALRVVRDAYGVAA